ncbi:MAG: PAS domain S-box protein [Capsulimonas sp.]|uniref:PAS domain S-box protein n=1 Tax=Capsulimonas sp. TaxID=2494211 RepID=UPI0032668065
MNAVTTQFTPFATIVLDEAGTILSFDSEAETLFGYAASDCLGQDLTAIMPEARRLYVSPESSQLTQGDYRLNALYQHSDPIPVEISLRSVEMLERSLVIATLHPIQPSFFVETSANASDNADENLLLLAQASHRFQELFQGLPVACVCYDEHGQIYEWNRAYHELTGYSPDQLLTMKVWDTVDSDADRTRTRDACRQVFSGHVAETIECAVVRADKTRYTALCNAFAIRNSEGAVIGAINTHQDITKHKQAEADLRMKENHLRTVITGAPIVLFGFDENGIFTVSEGRGLELQGLKPGETVGRSLYEIYKDVPEIVHACRSALAGNTVTSIDKLGANYYEAWYSPIRDDAGRVTGAVGVATDITQKHLAEEALKATTEHLTRILETVAEGIAIVDDNGRYTFANPAAEAILGVAREEITQQVYYESSWRMRGANGEYCALEVLPITQALISGRPVYDLELSFDRTDGRSITLSINAAPLTDEHGVVTGAVTSFVDITERKLSEQALHDAQEKLEMRVVERTRALGAANGALHEEIVKHKLAEETTRRSNALLKAQQEAAPDGILILDEDQKIASVNRRFTEIWDIPADLIEQGDHQKLVDYKMQRIEGQESFLNLKRKEIEFPHLTHNFELQLLNGRILEGYSAPVVSGDGETLYGRIVSHRDITERKQAEEELQLITAQTEMILAAISSVLIGVDENDKIITWNHAARTLFGPAAADVLGLPFRECGIQWDWDFLLDAVQICRNSGQNLRVADTAYTRADGKDGILGLSINPISTYTGDTMGFVVIGTDITDRRVLEGQLAQSQKLESIGQLAAGIAHEINTPVQYLGDNTRFLQDAFTDIQGVLEAYSEVLEAAERGGADPALIAKTRSAVEAADVEYLTEEIPNAIKQSLEGLERVAHLVRAMKDFSHPGAAEKTAVDLNRTIDSTITVARNEWKYVADLVTKFDADLPLVHCLPGELNQVVLNMVVNAAHAISDVVGDGVNQKGVITIQTLHDGDWAEIRISDTGTGMPEHVKKKIFDPFFTTKGVGKGTGQGLAISHSVIVDKHGGAISVETEPGAGTTFIIRLPIDAAETEQDKAA